MKVVFTAWLLINGAWTHGSYEYGWWPYIMGNEEACQAALDYVSGKEPEGVKFTCETLEDSQKYITDLQR